VSVAELPLPDRGKFGEQRIAGEVTVIVVH